MLAGYLAFVRLLMRVVLPAIALAKVPACPRCRYPAKVVSVRVDAPSAVKMMGMAACPARPWLLKLVLVSAEFGRAHNCATDTPLAAARFFCATLNSSRKPFSKMFASFRFTWRHRPTAWLPT